MYILYAELTNNVLSYILWELMAFKCDCNLFFTDLNDFVTCQRSVSCQTFVTKLNTVLWWWVPLFVPYLILRIIIRTISDYCTNLYVMFQWVMRSYLIWCFLYCVLSYNNVRFLFHDTFQWVMLLYLIWWQLHVLLL